jgi:hypothetical protein
MARDKKKKLDSGEHGDESPAERAERLAAELMAEE